MHKIYLKLNKQVKIAFYNQAAILLDLKADKFILLDAEYSSLLKILLTHSFKKLQTKYIPDYTLNFDDKFVTKINIVINELRECEILSQNDHTKANIITMVNSKGVANLDWRLSPHKPIKHSLIGFCHIYLQILLTHYILNFKGINSLIKRSKLAHKKYHHQQPGPNHTTLEKLANLASLLDQTCVFFPLQTKCLAWAATYHRLALSMGIKCNLVIGVQAFPFMSHAWIEYNSCIISDNENLAKQLAVILKIPMEE